MRPSVSTMKRAGLRALSPGRRTPLASTKQSVGCAAVCAAEARRRRPAENLGRF